MSGGHPHVLFVVTNYPPHRGGVEQHVSSLAHRLVARGAAATVVCLGDEDGVRDDDGVLVHTLRRRLDVGDVLALPEPLAWRRLAGSLADGVTHVSTHTRFFPMSWLGLRLARRAGVPVVHTEHGSDHVRTPSAVVNAGALTVDRTMGRAVLRGATEVLAVSDRVADFVRRLSGREAEVFGNGVDVAAWRGADPVEPAPRLVFVGRLVDEKGWRAFLDVAARLAGEVPGLTAVLAGDGPRRAEVEAEVRRHDLGGVVQVLGMVDHAELARRLHGGVYVNPTTAAEGFQTTQIEALAAGARVVSYDVAGARMLRDAGAPLAVVTPGDEQTLLTEVRRELLAPSPAATMQSLAPWDWEVLTDRYLQVLARARTA